MNNSLNTVTNYKRVILPIIVINFLVNILLIYLTNLFEFSGEYQTVMVAIYFRIIFNLAIGLFFLKSFYERLSATYGRKQMIFLVIISTEVPLF